MTPSRGEEARGAPGHLKLRVSLLRGTLVAVAISCVVAIWWARASIVSACVGLALGFCVRELSEALAERRAARRQSG